MTLHDYLQQPRPAEFVRGRSDCTAFVAGWMAVVMGHPVQSLAVGSSLTDDKAHRIVTRAGGFAKLARRILSGHGWVPGPKPRDGDVILATCPGCYSRTLLGLWSAGHAVTIGADAQIRIVPPHLLTNLEAWCFPTF